jgi:hypothetical protein
VRTPLYGITAFFVLTKFLSKCAGLITKLAPNFALLPIAKALTNQLKNEQPETNHEESLSQAFTGMARDLIALANVTQRMFNSIWLTIVAPPSFYRDLKTAMSRCIQTVKGRYHGDANTSTSVLDVYKGLKRPNYIFQISPLLIRNDKIKEAVESLGPEYNG